MANNPARNYTARGRLSAKIGELAMDHQTGHEGSRTGWVANCPDCERAYIERRRIAWEIHD